MNKWASTTLIQYMHVQDVGICVPVYICASYGSVCTVVAVSRFLVRFGRHLSPADAPYSLLAAVCLLCLFLVFCVPFLSRGMGRPQSPIALVVYSHSVRDD